jgi:hypothetical protein
VRPLQLAYASTVHGTQGETVDASFVCPDVDAAGLYVGLTRGRLHHEALAVAPNDRVAKAKVAARMLRGGTELTMQDAVRAADAELRRAAKAPLSDALRAALTNRSLRARFSSTLCGDR